MRRLTWSIMGLVAMLCIGLAAPLVMADRGKHRDKHEDEDERLSVTVAFGRGLNTAQPGNAVNHVILPKKIKIKQGGVVHFLVAGFHQPMVYKPGTTPENVRAFIGNSTAPFVHDQNSLLVDPKDLPNDLFYAGINPAGGPLITPASANPSNAMNRVESVGLPAEEGVGTNGVASLKADPGVYLVICNVRGHFLDGMFAFVKVKEVKVEDEDEDEDD